MKFINTLKCFPPKSSVLSWLLPAIEFFGENFKVWQFKMKGIGQYSSFEKLRKVKFGNFSVMS